MQGPAKPRRILVVDAVQFTAQALTVILIEHGYDASPACNAAEAFAWSRVNRPDVLIVDAILGHTNGIRLAEKIVKGQPDCKVLVLAEASIAARLLGASPWLDDPFPVLAKPMNPRAILAFLASI